MTEKVSLRGFASPKMADVRQEISRRGGQAVPRERRAFSRDPSLAKEAGRLGGQRRREANKVEVELLHEFADGSIAQVPQKASGRTRRKVDRLVRLGYFYEIPAQAEPKHRAYAITHAGIAFLAWAETPEGQAWLNRPSKPRKLVLTPRTASETTP